jgi:hypothetical protein
LGPVAVVVDESGGLELEGLGISTKVSGTRAHDAKDPGGELGPGGA